MFFFIFSQWHMYRQAFGQCNPLYEIKNINHRIRKYINHRITMTWWLCSENGSTFLKVDFILLLCGGLVNVYHVDAHCTLGKVYLYGTCHLFSFCLNLIVLPQNISFSFQALNGHVKPLLVWIPDDPRQDGDLFVKQCWLWSLLMLLTLKGPVGYQDLEL